MNAKDFEKDRPFSALRSRAESHLARTTDHIVPINGVSPETTQDLIHDLRVHQVELEMQNDELRRVQGELETVRDKYVDLYDFAPIGYLTLDGKKRILEANLACSELLGTERKSLIHQVFHHFVIREDRDIFRDYFNRVFTDNTRHGCELRLQRDSENTQFHAQIEAIALQHGEESPGQCRMMIMDISRRRQEEMELQLAAKVFENSVEGVMISDAKGQILRVNRAFSLVTGYSEGDVVGRSPRVLRSGRHEKKFYSKMWLRIKEKGAWQGEIWNKRKNGEVYAEWLSISAIRDERGNVTHYVGIFSDVTEQKLSEERIKNLSYYDQLTSLPNRRLFQERLKQAMVRAHRDGQWVAVMFLDLDRFKTVNDTFGHAIGDLLLQKTAERLQQCVRASDTLARLGGDEFTVVLADLEGQQAAVKGAAAVADKMLAALTRPFDLPGQEIVTSTSIGIALYPQDSDTISDLLRYADSAMYQAKAQGRGNYIFYSQDIQVREVARARMEQDLRNALEQGSLELNYQPIIDLEDDTIVGIEALLRWNHPDWGSVALAEFMSLAENSCLVLAIGEWMLEEACRQNKAWQAMALPAVRIAVTLSARQLRHHDLAETVQQVLYRTRLDPAYLALEITERVAMRDPLVISEILSRLKSLGVWITIDDFGSDCFPLANLRRLPIDIIKISGGFVHTCANEPDDAAIVSTIIAMAHKLRLKTHAKGVETMAQQAFLREHRCDFAHGFLYTSPLTACEMERWLRSRVGRA